jgi:hypothetical protein
MSEKVSDEALGISESGSSYRSSVQVPPFTGVPVVVVEDGVVGAPHALNTKISSEKRERTIAREWGLGLLSIRSSSGKITTTKRSCLLHDRKQHAQVPGEVACHTLRAMKIDIRHAYFTPMDEPIPAL